MGFVNVSGTIAGLDLLGQRMDEAVHQTVRDSLHLIQGSAMALAPVGVAGNSTNAPGDLRRSIDVEGPEGADGVYTGRVGPTIVYGRQRELGGDIYPKNASRLVFSRFGETVFALHVYQKPEPYLKPAVDANLQNMEAIALGQALTAIAGS